MSTEIIRVPDIGGATDVEVIEISIEVGDIIEVVLSESTSAQNTTPYAMAREGSVCTSFPPL